MPLMIKICAYKKCIIFIIIYLSKNALIKKPLESSQNEEKYSPMKASFTFLWSSIIRNHTSTVFKEFKLLLIR